MEQRILLFGVIKVLDHKVLSKEILEIAGSYLLLLPLLKLHLESNLYLKIKNILKMALSKFTSGSAVKNRKSLLMTDFLLSLNLRGKKMGYMLADLLLQVHGGELCLKKH